MLIKYKCKDKFGITGVVEVEGRLFVTKDKNGKDVFAGDCCYSGNVEGYIRWSNAELAWIYEWDDKRGDTHSALVSKVSAIELIEDKD